MFGDPDFDYANAEYYRLNDQQIAIVEPGQEPPEGTDKIDKAAAEEFLTATGIDVKALTEAKTETVVLGGAGALMKAKAER